MHPALAPKPSTHRQLTLATLCGRIVLAAKWHGIGDLVALRPDTDQVEITFLFFL